jgi:hypothetical protein
MDRSHQPNARMLGKAKMAGFDDPSRIPRLADLVQYTTGILALVWPERAYAFNQIIVKQRLLQEVAAEMGLSERTMHRYLAGHNDALGAEDWFLIILELCREADGIGIAGAESLASCFYAASSTQYKPVVGPFQRAFFLLILEAFANAPLKETLRTLPWKSAGKDPLIAWPCFNLPAPLPRSQLPGLVSIMRACRNMQDKFKLCMLLLLLSEIEDGGIWKSLLAILNTGSASAIAAAGRIAKGDLPRALDLARLLISKTPDYRYGLLGILAWTPIHWQQLCDSIAEPRLKSLSPADALETCLNLFIA